MSTTTLIRPYGLTHQETLPADLVRPEPLERVVYDPGTQLAMLDGRPLVHDLDLMITMTVTYGTTNRDNKTDDNG